MSDRSKYPAKKYPFTCPTCGREYMLEERTYKKKITTHEDCPHCIRSRLRKQQSDEMWKNTTPEQKQVIINNLQKAAAEHRANMTEAERAELSRKHAEYASKQMTERWKDDVYRQKHIEATTKQMNEFWSSPGNEEEKQKRISAMHAGRDEFFKNADPERLAARAAKLSNVNKGNTNWYQISEEQRKTMAEAFLARVQDWRENRTEEETQRYLHKLSESEKRYAQTLSKEERIRRMQPAQDALVTWRENLSDEEKHRIEESRRNSWLKTYNALSPEEKSARIRNIFSRNSPRSQLNDRFEEMFKSSHLSNEFTCIPEYITFNAENNVSHSWDYGVINTSDKLIAVIDLDGEFFHADKCDYDGFHSKEEYDERRSLSVPDDVKVFVITENNFSSIFKSMIQSLILDYDDYIESLFQEYRSISFPYPKYTDNELNKSWERLCTMDCNDKHHQKLSLNTRIGDRIITHFHPSIYHASNVGKLSPYEAWYDDELLRKCIKNRIIYQSKLNPNKILQGFNISKIAPKVSVFSAGRAKMIIHRYLSEYNTIFDPFAGFGGRMLGTVSLKKRYIGQDIASRYVQENLDIIKFLNISDLAVVSEQDVLNSTGTYPCLFTCPPYGTKEIWEYRMDTNSCDEWIDICLSHFKCKKYVFVVDNTEKYKDYIVDTIQNKSHFALNDEYIVLIKKEDEV